MDLARAGKALSKARRDASPQAIGPTPPVLAGIILDTHLSPLYNSHCFFGGKHEENISTKYQKKEEEPRLQKKNEHEVRKGYYKKEEAERQEEVECLKAL